MSKRVLFRLNAGNIYGLGHFSRCYALSQIIENKAEIFFYIYSKNKETIQKLNHHHFNITFLNADEQNTFFQNIKSSDVVIIDGYNFSKSYFQSVKLLCDKLIVFDDFDAKIENVDAIINPFIETIETKITNIKYFLGYEYFILRKEFLKLQANLQRKGTIISLGATDSKDITSKILNYIINDDGFKPLHVVYTDLYSDVQKNYFSNLRKQSLIHTHLSLGAEDLCILMDSCKYGIFSASNILLEGLKRSLNCAFGYYVENQKKNYLSLLNKNVGLGLDNFDDFCIKDKLTVLTKKNFVKTDFISGLSSKINNIIDYILC